MRDGGVRVPGNVTNPMPDTDADVLPDATPGPFTDGGAVAPICGDGVVNQGSEECDGDFPAFRGCSTFGFDLGLLTCTAECAWDTSDCSGDEVCFDLADNDGDQDIDCADDDCTQMCEDPCGSAPEIAPPSTEEYVVGASELVAVVNGSTAGRPNTTSASCADSDGSGPEAIYLVTVAQTGKLDLTLQTTGDLTLSVRRACEDDESELTCASPRRLTRNVTAGDSLHVIVDGYAEEDSADFTLTVGTRERACGDGVLDPLGEAGHLAEECDDGELRDGDGCDMTCAVESSENEPLNSMLEEADPFALGAPRFGRIFPAGDVDVVAISVTTPNTTLSVASSGLGGANCASGEVNTQIELLDTDEEDNALLESDTDSGDGDCGRVVARGLPAGTYYARVTADADASPVTFPYSLQVLLSECGNGTRENDESCDDGNLTSGDGCSALCLGEQP